MILRTTVLATDLATVLRTSGAASIFMGRTPHEVRDELCRAAVR